jgi:serine/threonine-protein kinase
MSSSQPSPEPAAPTDQEIREARKLLELGLEPTDAEDAAEGKPFGDYQLFEELGRGNSCVVYRAWHAGIQPIVALKLMRDAKHATPEELLRFYDEAAAAADLSRAAAAAPDHPHIVPVYHAGERDGQPFITMRLFRGGNLRTALERIRRPRERAVRLLAKVARAVHFAHQNRVLHRDLKPANILLDEHDEPFVADFGLAKRLNENAVASCSSSVVGTYDYMAPEQATANCSLTPAADIYSLGVILYEILTSTVPLPASSDVQKLVLLTSDVPARPPRELDRNISRNLEVICLRALHKNPKARYQSAEEFAVSLERSCTPGGGDEPLPPLRERLESWARRHPRQLLVLLSLLSLLAVSALGTWWLWRSEQRAVRDALETNAFIAGSQAGAALSQLREYAERVEQAAREPAVLDICTQGQVIVDPAPSLQQYAAGFDSVAVFTTDARVLAQGPRPNPVVFERRYDFRDYFHGARQLAEKQLRRVYVARAFRTESYGRLAFAFSTPILDARGRWVGVLMATLSAKSVFGAVKMEDAAQGQHITSALIGPRGHDRGARPGAPLPSDFTFLVHPGLAEGKEYTLPSSFSSELRAAFGSSAPPGAQFTMQYVPPVKAGDYQDSMPGFTGRWLAAFAPVGKTGFVVLVRTPRKTLLDWP